MGKTLLYGLVITIIIVFSAPAHSYSQQLSLSKQPMDIMITSPISGQQAPIGSDFTISGTSTGNTDSGCKVYVGWNGLKPYQLADAIGPNGYNDYSMWTFTYTDRYHTIAVGPNILTAELSCPDNNNNSVLTKDDNITVTGIDIPPQSSTTTDNGYTNHHKYSGPDYLPIKRGSVKDGSQGGGSGVVVPPTPTECVLMFVSDRHGGTDHGQGTGDTGDGGKKKGSGDGGKKKGSGDGDTKKGSGDGGKKKGSGDGGKKKGSGNGGTDNTGNGGTDNTGNGGTDNTGNGGTDNTGNGGTDNTGNGGTDNTGNGGTDNTNCGS